MDVNRGLHPLQSCGQSRGSVQKMAGRALRGKNRFVRENQLGVAQNTLLPLATQKTQRAKTGAARAPWDGPTFPACPKSAKPSRPRLHISGGRSCAQRAHPVQERFFDDLMTGRICRPSNTRRRKGAIRKMRQPRYLWRMTSRAAGEGAVGAAEADPDVYSDPGRHPRHPSLSPRFGRMATRT